MERELKGCAFPDVRLGERLRRLLEQMSDGFGASISMACQDWASTKAAYRFFANGQVSEAELLGGHFSAPRERVASAKGPVLVLHGTPEFSYQRENGKAIGLRHRMVAGRDLQGRLRPRTVCGLQMPSSLAVSTKGAAAWAGRRQVLDAQRVQGLQCAQKESQSCADTH